MSLTRAFPQPFLAVVLAALTSLALGNLWSAELNTPHLFGFANSSGGYPALDTPHLIVVLFLMVGVAAAYKFSIHIGRSRKVEMTSVPLYLIAVLVPSVPIDATAAVLGVQEGEMLVRKERCNLLSDVVTASARWAIVVLIGSAFAHLTGEHTTSSVPGAGGTFMLVGAAVVMWLGDSLTSPLVIAPMSGDRPLAVLLFNTRESAGVEIAQYLLGLLGAVAASAQIWAVVLLALPMTMIYVAFKNLKETHSSTLTMLVNMADTVDLRDPYTGGHSRRVAASTANILRELELHGPEAELIVAAARVHDIGKIAIPDYVLNKPGRLTEEEEAIMQTHPDRGADLLARYSDFARGVDIVRHHHESWDGTGYPHRLRGTDIPFGARVIAVADSFDAMTSDRPYRKAMTAEKASAILRDGRGGQWDAAIVDAFLKTVSTTDQKNTATKTPASWLVNSPIHSRPHPRSLQ
jgi:HD-GYP domain-containing protein (c-di-GMP phosphodiesterase class II)